MSDFDDEFDTIDEQALAELRDFEERYASQSPSKPPAQPTRSEKKVATPSDDSDLFDFSLDNEELALLEEAAVKKQNNQTFAPPTFRAPVSNPSTSKQVNLFGEVIQEEERQQSRSNSGQKLLKTKVWDHTTFAKTGWKSTKPPKKGKGKGKAKANGNDNEEDEECVDLEGLPTPFMPLEPITEMELKPDELTMNEWIYPLNRPKRDYQFNIVKHSLFDNCMVAIPTGTGKTFIAGCVMLNYYRWFPEGKIIFVAPTKPLVAQQIEACHQVCGIPGTDAMELTGLIASNIRAAYWQSKRVFYMTPQTLVNDLATGNCDPKSIVLLVVDEAHKGTGDYAYAQIVRFLMATNPFFRLLALSATPGSKTETVQAVCDALHISHIEIRNEESMDVQRYMHKRTTSKHLIEMQGNVKKVQDTLATLMKPMFSRLTQEGLIYSKSVLSVSPFACQQAGRQLAPNKKYLWSTCSSLAQLSRAMEYLTDFSVGMCYTALQEILSPKKGEKGPKNSVTKEPAFMACIQEIERQRRENKDRFPTHPKMEKLRELAIQHFAGVELELEAEAAPGTKPADSNTKMIIFCNYRECVEEIVEMLKEQEPMIRAHRFVGQGTDKKGTKGVTQKEQLAVIDGFKKGIHNVLVSTSIGEEGLDIGEVDIIVCYDTQKGPIRMIQRFGRTGRKKEGKVELLLSKDREDKNFVKALDKYADVQDTIVKGSELELYGDVPRLLPDHVRPKCLEIVMEIIPYEREERTSGRGSRQTSSKTGVKSRQPSMKSYGKKEKKPVLKRTRVERLDEDEEEEEKSPSKRKKFVQSDSDSDERAPKKRAKAPKRAVSIPTSVPTGFQSVKEMMRTQSSTVPTSSSQKPKPSTSTFAKSTATRRLETSKVKKAPVEDKQSLPPKNNYDWLVGSDDEDTKPSVPKIPTKGAKLEKPAVIELDDSDKEDSDVEVLADTLVSPRKPSFAFNAFKSRPAKKEVPAPSVSFPIKRNVQEQRHNPRVEDISEELSSPVLTRLKKRDIKNLMAPPPLPLESPSPIRSNAQRKQAQARVKRSILDNPNFLEMEAIHSGDEVDAGSSDSEGVANSSDREFVVDTSATQVDSEYDQSAVYRQGLFTQAPIGGPAFANKPIRNGYLGRGRGTPLIRRYGMASSSPDKDSELDTYSLGSFVVEDDDDILLDDSAEV